MDIILHSPGQKKQCQTMDFVGVLFFRKLLVVGSVLTQKQVFVLYLVCLFFDLFFLRRKHIEVFIKKFFVKDFWLR